jgi:hypothetical protein
MSFPLNAAIGTVVGVVCALEAGVARAAAPLDDLCISDICLERSNVAEAALVTKLGKGQRTKTPGGRGTAAICYTSRDGQVSFEFEFVGDGHAHGRFALESLFVTTEPMCPSSGALAPLTPGIGPLRIGQPEAEVVKMYGPPSRIDDAVARETRDSRYAGTKYSKRFGETVFVYGRPDDSAFVFVYFSNGRVKSIWASIGE